LYIDKSLQLPEILLQSVQTKNDYIQTGLNNGIQIVAVPDPSLHYAVVGAFVAMGPRFEPLHETGISHFIEHMLFQGSKAYPTSEEITRAVDRIAGQIIASTSPEYCYFGLAVHHKYLPEAIGILADILKHPLFDLDEIEHEKKIVLEERAQFHDRYQHNLSVDELLYNLLTRSDDQDISIIGTATNIEKFHRDVLIDYWQRFFVARNIVLSVAGAFDFDQTLVKLGEHFEDIPMGAAAQPQAQQSVEEGPKWIFRPQAGPTLSVALAWRAVAFDHPDYAGYAAITEFLGAGTNSRLFTRIREELGLVYDISSTLVSGSRLGWLQVDTIVRPSNYTRTLDAIFRVVDDFLVRRLSEEELAICKEKLKCSLEIAHDDPAETASWYAKQALFLRNTNRIITLAQELEQIENLSVDRLYDVAQETFAPRHCYLVVVGPVNWLLKRRTRRLMSCLDRD